MTQTVHTFGVGKGIIPVMQSTNMGQSVLKFINLLLMSPFVSQKLHNRVCV
jgi:hypothetical protein